MVDGLLMALVAGGHVLLEGAPGLAKTLACKCLARITGLSWKRIQFTPDLLPADVTGTMIWNAAAGSLNVRKGPVFANIVLADEINRAPAKVQSALLEAMQERQVSIGGETYPLPAPFMTLATENPIEQEGVYSLPEAELDRFLLKIIISYPSAADELAIVKLENSSLNRENDLGLSVILDGATLKALRETVQRIKVDERVTSYMVSLVQATRPGGREKNSASRSTFYNHIALGASPRASIALYKCARVEAMFQGRDYVNPEDVKAVALPVLRHRLILSYEAEAEAQSADALISRILSLIPLP
jgi:MoxR-like ATPase